MKLIRYAYPQTQANSAINRLFDLGAPTIGRFGSFLDDFLGDESALNQPALDLYEGDQSYHANFELPGVRKDQVDLELENAVLTIRSHEKKGKDDELSCPKFERSISVPDGVDLEKVSATMRDGILMVTMPKAEARQPRQIRIK